MSTPTRLAAWRLAFGAAAPLIILGTVRHPRVPGMPAMLAHPDWVLSHVVMLAGYLALLAGLLLYRRDQRAPSGPWVRLAIVGATLQVVEAAFHAGAVVDLGRLNAGHATPVLSAHLLLTMLFYPAFSLAMGGLIVAAARQRALGSWWIAPLGLLGLLCHAAAAIVVVLLEIPLGVLFAGIALFGLWLLLAALLPARRPAVGPTAAHAPVPARTSVAVP